MSKKSEKRGEKKKGKVKVKSLEILLSVHARTSQADILNLDQKAVFSVRPVNGFVIRFISL